MDRTGEWDDRQSAGGLLAGKSVSHLNDANGCGLHGQGLRWQLYWRRRRVLLEVSEAVVGLIDSVLQKHER